MGLPATKICTTCGKLKPQGDFFNGEPHRDGTPSLRGRCKKCCTKQNKQIRLANPKKYKEISKKWRIKNQEIIKIKRNVYLNNNREKVNEQSKKWRQRNPEKVKEMSAKSRWKAKLRCSTEHFKNKIKKNRIENQKALREYNRKYRIKNKDRLKDWRLKNQERYLTSYLRPLYKITLSQRDSIWENQKRKCPVCHKDLDYKDIVVDHDHKCCPGERSCGKCIRGLLHNRCNRGLGIFYDSIQQMEMAIIYLKLPHIIFPLEKG